MDNNTGRCEGCGEPLAPMKYQGNPKRFCSERCRVRAYRRDQPGYRERELAAQRARARARAVERVDGSSQARP